MSVGKVHTDKLSRLKQEEAYSLGVSELIAKLQSKTKLFLRKLEIEDDQIDLANKGFCDFNAYRGQVGIAKPIDGITSRLTRIGEFKVFGWKIPLSKVWPTKGCFESPFC